MFYIYAKVIIEVEILQSNDLIGKIVISKAGRDKNHLYVLVQCIDSEYVLVANGSTKTIDKPKKKKLKHISVMENADKELVDAIIQKDRSVDLMIKRFLKLKGIVKEG